ncbi:ATP-grasp domain-containing protein [Streptomyces sp. SP17BM10]|uniref:ATP-grasp domain-containing protein n=1 Tax=Streptomyces sp. SP17BM10 TaxID=3002530 RepID=UPI002E78C0DA|nr:ATP-grasp domain-containing protein [Streptomyces sp. SP17BM10]MEE1786232.1 ATP-grasp domain-containing protein [Streptomyces sp. SP17BM10]
MNKILYVYVKGGAPLEYAFPRIAACGELHVLALAPLPTTAEEVWRPSCTSIELVPDAPRGDELVDLIVEHAKAVGADAVLTLSEFAVLAVAHAAGRLGLAGAGEGILRARDKRLMREAWAAAGVPIPAFRRVDSLADLEAALAAFTPPLLLKPAWGAGSVAQIVLEAPEDAAPAWEEIERGLRAGSRVGMNELYAADTDRDRLVEEIAQGSTGGWYEEPGYGDYVSVEGIVADGVYHPLAITAKLPTVPSFVEVASTSPTVLPVPLQRRIEEVSRQAVDALGLENCGTHTELKLMADGGLVVIETAARFGGLLTTRQVHEVFGLDPIGMLVRQLLGECVDYPAAMPTHGVRAAASVAVVAADAAGTPWRSRPVWNPRAVDWQALLSPGSTIEAVPAFTLPEGEPVPAFDPAAGSRNWLGVYLLTAVDAATLQRDCNAVLNGLEAALNRAGA